MWKKLDISSKEIIESYTKGKFSICDYSFTNLLLWSEGDNLQYMVEDEVLYIKGNYMGEESYFLPISFNGSIKKVKEAVEKILNKGYTIELIPEEYLLNFKDEFIIEEMKDSFDYIYSVEDLAFLKGRKYSKKKNKINQFKKNYNWEYQTITPENIKLVEEYQNKWCLKKKCHENDTLNSESLGLETIFKNFDKLNLLGGVIFVDEEVIGYTIGEELNEESLVIHIEKADELYNGSYQAINAIFLENTGLNYKKVNREDDSGVPGMRKAKESYYPILTLKKHRILSKK